jgi:hypothetical protein
MSDDIALAEPQAAPPARALSPDYKARRAAGLVELSPRDKQLAEYMTVGTSHARAVRLGFLQNEPLSLEQAAAVLDMRRRNARQVFASPQFQKLYAKSIADMRSGQHARMVKHMVSIADDEGGGTAATKSVRLKAAKAVLGEQDAALNVNVAVQNTVAGPRFGYVYAPCDRPAKAVTIEAEPVRERLSDGLVAAHQREERETIASKAVDAYRLEQAAAEAARLEREAAERALLQPVFTPDVGEAELARRRAREAAARKWGR